MIAGEPGHVCNNCHSFCINRPDAMTIHARFPFLMAVARNGDTRDVVDYVSDLLLYDFDGNEVTATPAISRPGMLETFPAWSPDGWYLYFCRTPSMSQSEFATRYAEVKQEKS